MAQGIKFVEIPEVGFTREQVETFIRQGYTLWGVLPLARPVASQIMQGGGAPALDVMVLVQNSTSVPTNMLAHHLIQAKQSHGGLNYVAQQFFGLSLGELQSSWDAAKTRTNEPGNPIN